MSDFKGLKKTIVYTSATEKKFIEGALKILSIIHKKSPSAVLEDLLNKALLPENPNAKTICKELYSNEINCFSAMEKIFDIYASGINGEAKYCNGYELIGYLHSRLMFASFPYEKASKDSQQYLCSNFYQIYKLIEVKCSTKHEDTLLVYESPVKYVKFHLDEAINEPEHFHPINLTDIIKKHWDILGNYTYTYRTLCALCKILKEFNEDSSEETIALINLFSKLSKDWEDTSL